MYNQIAVIASVAQEETTHEGSALSFQNTYFFSIINIIILFLLLKWILFKPVSRIMSERAERIKKNIENAEESKREAENLKNGYKDQLEKIKEEASTILNNSRQKAVSEAEIIITKAKEEAEMIIRKAREQGELEAQTAMENAKAQIVNLALEAASKVIEKNMDNEVNRKLVEDFINEVGAA